MSKIQAFFKVRIQGTRTVRGGPVNVPEITMIFIFIVSNLEILGDILSINTHVGRGTSNYPLRENSRNFRNFMVANFWTLKKTNEHLPNRNEYSILSWKKHMVPFGCTFTNWKCWSWKETCHTWCALISSSHPWILNEPTFGLEAQPSPTDWELSHISSPKNNTFTVFRTIFHTGFHLGIPWDLFPNMRTRRVGT